MNTTTKKLIQSFIIVPLVATTLSMNTFTASINKSVALLTATDQVTVTPEEAALQAKREETAAKIDAYYTKYDMPLAGSGMKLVLAAEKNGIDPYLVPAISVQESTGGKFACKNNPFGFGSCKIGYKSFDEAIEAVAAHVGGNNPRTARYYAGKSTRAILLTYNPPSIHPGYDDEVMAIMNRMSKMPIEAK